MSASTLRITSRRLARLGWIGPAALAVTWLIGCTGEVSHGVGGPMNMGTAGTSSTTGGVGSGAGGSAMVTPECASGVHPGRAPVRRLTRFEYNNAVRDLFGDTSAPGNALPPETIARTGNVFGNDADLLSVSSNLADQWGKVAADIAARATATPDALGKLATCASAAAPDDTCTKSVIQSLVSRAYHRDALPAEVDSFLMLEKAVQAKATYASGIAAVIEAVLQGPEFLYRIELGAPAADHPELRKPTADETATRLSFLFWGTIPDDALRMAAKSGQLATPAGIKAQAQRLVDAPQARPVVRFFFDNLLPISGLNNLARDKTKFPIYSPQFADALHEETQQFLEHEIFDAGSTGTWASALTAPYTYVNDTLATFYGIPGITGSTFQKANIPDPSKRLGLLTQAGIMTGTITSNESNPVLRGSFMINKILCMNIQLPTDPAILMQVKVPEGVSGPTARDRFTKHRAQPVCAGCHSLLDPVGFALENYDPIGQWRDQENNVTIDASGSVPNTDGVVNGPVELVKKIAGAEAAQNCFAQHWMEFGYGKTLDAGDACVQQSMNNAFKQSGGNIKQLLVDLTQTDAFLYMPAKD
jgi:Protein of unknown function (DUF1592)/Protein of unknown function (DUF1588)/Protein of unknown function (DUF1587)/Protein of unknown function (DUF1585)/Protein of unknown function (DUF1595)